jgi:hypothetical protein
VVDQPQDWGRGWINTLNSMNSGVYGYFSPLSSFLAAGEDEEAEWKPQVYRIFALLGYPISEKDVELFWVGGITIG